MSAESIARWNAIPMAGPETGPAGASSLKRTRDDGDDSDDDISLISRSPSPPAPGDAMDVDKYDEYARGVEREVITVETKISSTNKGFAMLSKLGWVEGTPLGLSGDGRVDPVPFILKNDLTGLGKTNQDVRMIETTVAQRRELDSERQTKESEEQRKARQETVAKRAAVQSEITNVLRAFYCDLCEKQFQNVAQYDEHTNSYAHHHKARFRDMQAAQKVTFGGSQEERKEKERKREEKELRKLAKAAGIKLTKPNVPTSAVNVPSAQPTAMAAVADPGDSSSTASKKLGWAAVGPAAAQSFAVHSTPPTNASRSSWATVGARETQGASASQSGGWAAVSQPPPTPLPTHHLPDAPTFRTGGWTSLDSSISSSGGPTPEPVLPVPPPAAPMPPPAARVGWARVSTSEPSAGTGQAVAPPISNPSLPPTKPPVPSAPPAQRQEASRSGWQQFKAGGGRRR